MALPILRSNFWVPGDVKSGLAILSLFFLSTKGILVFGTDE